MPESLTRPLFDPADAWKAWWGSFGLRAPLSGDVTQSIDAGFVRTMADQLGFININTSRAGDPELGRRITEQVASYGRQLGKILDALDVPIRADSRPDLRRKDDQAKLEELQSLRAEVEAVKARTAADRLDQLVSDVRALRADPDANAEALRRLHEALD